MSDQRYGDGSVKYIADFVKRIYTKDKIKVGWLLLGDINTGSSRIHGINIHNYLLTKGVDSIICQTSSGMNRHLVLSDQEQERLLTSGINILVFQKVFDEKAVAFSKAARTRGIRTIFLLSDKHETEMVNVVDQLVVTSEFLKNYFDSNFGTHAAVIEDAIEVPAALFKEHRDKDSLQLVWVGHSDNWNTLEIARNVLAKRADGIFALKTISNHPDADVPWELATVYGEILAADIAIIPAFDDNWGKSKSNNRLTMFMAMGMPVIASCIPSYRTIIRNGTNGFLVDSEAQWLESLEVLRDQQARSRIGSRARRGVTAAYSIDMIGRQWISLFKRLIRA